MYPVRILLLCVLSLPAFAGAQVAQQKKPGDPPAGQTLDVHVPYLLSQDINHEDYYFSQLLSLALEKTRASDGAWQMVPSREWLRDKRLRLALDQGLVDIIWSQTNKRFEHQMRRIPFPLVNGLGHYRLFLIREADQHLFDEVKSLQDLRKLTGGMGSQWPDVEIMRANQLPLVTAPGYGKLFKMLAAGRFDYFSRGIYQIHSEVNFYPDLPLAIEQRLIVSYPSEFNFFVRKDDAVLADRVLRGLRLAKQDGSFDELFNRVPRYRWAMEEFSKGDRVMLKLQTHQ